MSWIKSSNGSTAQDPVLNGNGSKQFDAKYGDTTQYDERLANVSECAHSENRFSVLEGAEIKDKSERIGVDGCEDGGKSGQDGQS